MILLTGTHIYTRFYQDTRAEILERRLPRQNTYNIHIYSHSTGIFIQTTTYLGIGTDIDPEIREPK